MREKLLYFHGRIFPQNHFGIQVVRTVNLVHEFPAPAARGQDHPISPDGNDLRDPAFTGCDHCRDGTVLCTESDPASNINAHAKVDIPGRAQQGASHIPGGVIV